MGKRSSFERVERDFYPTPIEAIKPLVDHLPKKFTYAEPCAGELHLAINLNKLIPDSYPVYLWDIEKRHPDVQVRDALTITKEDLISSYIRIDYIITNPPWDRKLLHPMIEIFASLKPTWLLFDADWMHTKQAIPYLEYCEKIVSVGRVKWIPDSKATGKDNCAWYLFNATRQKKLVDPDNYQNCITKFYGRK